MEQTMENDGVANRLLCSLSPATMEAAIVLNFWKDEVAPTNPIYISFTPAHTSHSPTMVQPDRDFDSTKTCKKGF